MRTHEDRRQKMVRLEEDFFSQLRQLGGSGDGFVFVVEGCDSKSKFHRLPLDSTTVVLLDDPSKVDDVYVQV